MVYFEYALRQFGRHYAKSKLKHLSFLKCEYYNHLTYQRYRILSFPHKPKPSVQQGQLKNHNKESH